MKKKKNGRPVSPIYIIALIWLLYSLRWPIFSIVRLLGVVLLSVIGFVIAVIVASTRQSRKEKEAAQAKEKPAQVDAAQDKPVQEKKAPEKPKYAPEVQAVVDEGEKAHSELQRLYASIPNLSVKYKIQELMDVSDKIIQDAVNDPSDVPQIKKFLDYYLPTTIKLLNAYDRMGAQGIEGENISGTMQSIEEMLDTSVEAYKKLLDSLFANQAMDIETDINVMNTLLRREGLAGSAGSDFHLPNT